MIKNKVIKDGPTTAPAGPPIQAMRALLFLIEGYYYKIKSITSLITEKRYTFLGNEYTYVIND